MDEIQRCPNCKVILGVGEDFGVWCHCWCPNCEQNFIWDGKKYFAMTTKVYDFLGRASAYTY